MTNNTSIKNVKKQTIEYIYIYICTIYLTVLVIKQKKYIIFYPFTDIYLYIYKYI